jgi:mannose-6-phosphate isomerase
MAAEPKMLKDYLCWITDAALPTWAERGFDQAAGRFRERLDLTGAPIMLPHRAMVQARQIFVFAHAAELGWAPDGARLAETAMAALLRDFADDSGDETSFAFSIDPASRAIVSEARDAYAHAFVLFSIAALYRLNGDAALLDLADRIVRFIERQLGDPVHGGLFDAVPPPPEKRQNPHMHLLEAYLFLERAAPGRGFLDRAAGLVALFQRHFLRDGVLLEYFAPDWAVGSRAAWEPGHHFEWAWLLGEYGTLSDKALRSDSDTLYQVAIQRGVAANGLIIDELAPDMTVLKPSHRLWPHTEAIKAAVARAGDTSALAFAGSMAGGLLGTFLDRPFTGGWIDHVSAEGVPLVDHVPASSLYHLVLAASVASTAIADGGFAGPSSLAKAEE